MTWLERLLGRIVPRVQEITNNDGIVYLRRFFLFNSERFGRIYLHHILRSDEDKHMHDHPWNFVSIIIGGPGYYEETPVPGYTNFSFQKWYPRWSILRRKAESIHKVQLKTTYELICAKSLLFCLKPVFTPVWTLVFVSAKKRSWGFQTENGWVHWKTYLENTKRAVKQIVDMM